jgi:hypothetical protein
VARLRRGVALKRKARGNSLFRSASLSNESLALIQKKNSVRPKIISAEKYQQWIENNIELPRRHRIVNSARQIGPKQFSCLERRELLRHGTGVAKTCAPKSKPGRIVIKKT